MSIFDPGEYPLPQWTDTTILAELPLTELDEGPVMCRQQPNDAVDRTLAAWDAPLIWHHQLSQIKISRKFQGETALHFAFEDRVPQTVWAKSWNLWYDHALMYRQPLPRDLLLTAEVATEELTTGYGADNVDHQRPWVGLVARMQDLRRYYFLTMEYPGKVALYRRDDHQWLTIASAQVHWDTWTKYRLTWQLDGSTMRIWLNDMFLFTASDYAYNSGYAGVRATCTSFITDLKIGQLPDQSARPASNTGKQTPALPQPKIIRTIDLTELGELSKTPRHHASMKLGRFANAQTEQQIVVRLFNREDDKNHALVDLHGNVIWIAAWPDAEKLHATAPNADGFSDLIAVSKATLYRIDGRTGSIIQQAPAPVATDGKTIGPSNGPTVMADLDGDGRRETFFLTCGCNDRHLWAYNDQLEQLWYVKTLSGQGHGAHLSVCDINGDGRDEIAAGACLINADGQIQWQQEEVVRRLKCPNGHHIDSSVMGFFDGPQAPPTIHYQASSAGHLVVNAHTGQLIAVHPQGHVQSVSAGAVIPNADGVQVISSNRWGSYGCSGIYSGQGDRLGRLQPGFTCQNTVPVNWDGSGLEYLLVFDGQGYRGIYDHTGQRLIDMDHLVPYHDALAQRHDRTNVLVAPLTGGHCDDLLIRIHSKLLIVSADRTFTEGQKVYAPQRFCRVSWPNWQKYDENNATTHNADSFD